MRWARYSWSLSGLKHLGGCLHIWNLPNGFPKWGWYCPTWGWYKKGTWVSSQGGIEKVSENLGCAYFRKTAQNSGEKPGLQNDSLMTLKGGGERLRFFGIFYPRKWWTIWQARIFVCEMGGGKNPATSDDFGVTPKLLSLSITWYRCYKPVAQMALVAMVSQDLSLGI